MIEWRRVPWPLWAYSAVTLLSAILIEVKAHGPIPAKVLFAAVVSTTSIAATLESIVK